MSRVSRVAAYATFFAFPHGCCVCLVLKQHIQQWLHLISFRVAAHVTIVASNEWVSRVAAHATTVAHASTTTAPGSTIAWVFFFFKFVFCLEPSVYWCVNDMRMYYMYVHAGTYVYMYYIHIYIQVHTHCICRAHILYIWSKCMYV